MKNSHWEKFYKGKSLDQIPWQRTQADWLKHLVDSEKITGESSLDLGCGTGMKSIYLVKHGFNKAVGVDISTSAIDYAKKNAKEAEVSDKIDFLVGDIVDLSFLDEQKFDFILDWAALHCIEREEHPKYIEQIVAHSKSKTLLLLRVFSSNNPAKEDFIDKTVSKNICVFQKEAVTRLFSKYFEILEFKKSLPQRKDNLIFIEFLMERKAD